MIIFTINGSPVTIAALQRRDQLGGSDPFVAAVYTAFSTLHLRIPLRRVTTFGNAVQMDSIVETITGTIFTLTILLDGSINPRVTLAITSPQRWSDLAAIMALAEALLTLALTASVGNLSLEVV